jgi:hypothetical protein
MRIKRNLLRSAFLLTAIAALAMGLTVGASAAPPTVAAASRSGPPAAALGDFASRIETLGVMHYPNSFTEAELTASGVTEVYIANPADQAFISAVRSLNSGHYPVKFIGTRRSYAQLDKINQRVAAASAKLRSEGIYLADSYPDPATGAVKIDIWKPVAAFISKLASFTGHSMTSGNYAAIASSVLNRMFGSGATLGHETENHVVPASRNDDFAPFFGGDLLEFPGDECTGGFNVFNQHGSEFMLSAGHCGSGTVKNGVGGPIGSTSSNWHSPTSGYDVQAIAVPNAVGRVWLNGTTHAAVSGAVVPAVGSSVTFNGYFTGRKTVTVNAVDITVENAWDPVGGYFYNAAHQVEGGAGVDNVCVKGDSGGPVFTPSGGTSVKAIGIILGFNNGTGHPQACFATMITAIDSAKSLTLMTS